MKKDCKKEKGGEYCFKMKRIGERGKRRKESKTRKREGEKGVTVNIKNEK